MIEPGPAVPLGGSQVDEDHSRQQEENTRSKELFQRLQGKPFWIWNVAGSPVL
ncbi:MAG: hypothetical protein ACJ71K_17675 [Nitrososphaeraceae archaeon]